MVERKEFGKLRNLAAVSVLMPAAVMSGHVSSAAAAPSATFESGHHIVMDRLSGPDASRDLNFFEQLDMYLETSYGKALASAAVVGTLALLWSARKINRETDSESQEKLAIFSSVIAISFASVLLAESFGEVNSKVPASLFEAFMVTQTALNFWRVAQRNRDLQKRSAALLMSASLVTISSIFLVETVK